MGITSGRDDATAFEVLLRELRGSETDLARLVERIVLRKLSQVAVSSSAVAAWEQRAPDAWDKVRKWLREQGVTIVIV